MTSQYIEKRLLKYIPKEIRRYVVWLDFEPSSHTYFLTFEKDGKEVSAENSDTVSELNWNAKQCMAELEAGRERGNNDTQTGS